MLTLVKSDRPKSLSQISTNTQEGREPKKSGFQERMESQGWELLVNESLLYDLKNPVYVPEKRAHRHEGMRFVWPPLTEGQIKQRFLNSNCFADVAVSREAYDVYGNRIKDHVVAVYVKRETK